MRKPLSLIICFLFMIARLGVYAQIVVPKPQANKPETTKAAITAQATPKALAQVTKIDTIYVKAAECPPNCGKQPDTMEWILILSPIILFFIVLFFIRMMAGGRFNLAAALTENELKSKIEINPAFKPESKEILQILLSNPISAAALTPTIQVSDSSSAPSSSRYAAIITVFFGLAMIACFMTYYIYSFIETPGKTVDLSYLKDVFIALLVGIAPYSFNRLSSGLQSKSGA
ncbi:MAG: hypothetical protein JST90_00505 [Bacteroidetes bacterium]|nr:hypothetical protein [Bacteroidota bacterium]